MPYNFFRKQFPIIAFLSTATIGLVAWQGKQKFNDVPGSITDTIPKQKQIKNIDEALRNLEKGQAEIEKAMRLLEGEMETPSSPLLPHSPIEVEKMMADVAQSLKEIDVEKTRKETTKALRDINKVEIETEVAKALRELHAEQMKADVEASLRKVEIEKLKVEIEQVQKLELAKINSELRKAKPEIEKSLKEATKKLEKEKEVLKEFKAFKEGLEKDNLIPKNGPYKIEHKDGQLIINGKLQSKDVYGKYKGILQKHKNFIMESSNDLIHIN